MFELKDGSKMTEPDEATAASGSQENNAEQKNHALVEEYEAKLDQIADVIARVRHEINNPLAGVLGQAQLLLREDLNEKARKRAQTIEELALRLRDIVAQLRHIQRPLKSSGADQSDSG
jgi:signal transduction histidine kinase